MLSSISHDTVTPRSCYNPPNFHVRFEHPLPNLRRWCCQLSSCIILLDPPMFLIFFHQDCPIVYRCTRQDRNHAFGVLHVFALLMNPRTTGRSQRSRSHSTLLMMYTWRDLQAKVTFSVLQALCNRSPTWANAIPPSLRFRFRISAWENIFLAHHGA